MIDYLLMNVTKELKYELRNLQKRYDETRHGIAGIEKLLSFHLTTPCEKRQELIKEYWLWLDQVEEANYCNARQWIKDSQYRETFNDPPPPNVFGVHDPYAYVEYVKQRLRGIREDGESQGRAILKEIGEFHAKVLAIRSGSPWRRIGWFVLAGVVGATLATVARLLIN
jgi:hypothetical protein